MPSKDFVHAVPAAPFYVLLPTNACDDMSLSTANPKMPTAGIVPFAVAPVPSNEVYILLAKEQFVSGWKYGSEKWCHFSGRADSHDLSPECTAVREFMEESMGSVATETVSNEQEQSGRRFKTMYHQQTKKIRQDLVKHRYTHKITLSKDNRLLSAVASSHDASKVASSHDASSNMVSATFVLRVPWQPDVSRKFDRWRGHLIKLKQAVSKYKQVTQEVRQDGHENLLLPGDRFTVASSEVSGIVVDLGWDAVRGIGYDVVWDLSSSHSAEEHAKSRVFCEISGKHVTLAKLLCRSWQQLLITYEELPSFLRCHPAVEVTRHRDTGIIIDICTVDSHLEKQSVAWWSLHRIKNVLRNGGMFRSEYFRPNFLPSLAVLLDLFMPALYRQPQCNSVPDVKLPQSKVPSFRRNYSVKIVPWRTFSLGQDEAS